MTHETDEIGMLTQEEVNRIWKRSVSVGNSSHHLAIAQAQHQADIEKVRAALLLLGGHIGREDLAKCEQAVLEALGEDKANESPS